jgi:hypothetical protein
LRLGNWNARSRSNGLSLCVDAPTSSSGGYDFQKRRRRGKPGQGHEDVTIDSVNEGLSAAASVAVIVGVLAAIAGVVVATQTLKETQRAASATLMLKLRDALDDHRYAKITDEIEANDSAHPLLKKRGGKFQDTDVEGYIVNFEDVGYLVEENVIDARMAYDHFSYDVEKAWCNADVQRSCKTRGSRQKHYRHIRSVL